MGYSENIIYDASVNQAILETMAGTTFETTEYLAQQWASMTPVERSTALLQNGYTWQYNNAGEVVGWVRNPLSVTAQNPLHGAETISEGFSYSSAPADYIAGNGLGKADVVAETSGGTVTKVKTQPLQETQTASGKTIKEGSSITGIDIMVASTLALQTAGAVYNDWQTHRDWWDDLSDAIFENDNLSGHDINSAYTQASSTAPIYNPFVERSGKVVDVLMRRVEDAAGLSSYYTYMDETDLAVMIQNLSMQGAFNPDDYNYEQYEVGNIINLVGDEANMATVAKHINALNNQVNALDVGSIIYSSEVEIALHRAKSRAPIGSNCVEVICGGNATNHNMYCTVLVFPSTNDVEVQSIPSSYGGGVGVNLYNTAGSCLVSRFGDGDATYTDFSNADVVVTLNEIKTHREVGVGTTCRGSNVSLHIIEGGIPEQGVVINPDADLFVVPMEQALDSYIEAMRNQYPDWYGEGFEAGYYDPNSDSFKKRKYLPISIPTYDPSLGDYVYPQDFTQKKVQSGKPYPEKNADPTTAPYPYTYPWYAPYTRYIPPTITGYDTPTPTPTPPSPVTPPLVSGSSNGLWAVYNPDFGALTGLGQYLWSSNIIDIVQKFFANPMDGIISLHQIYCTPTIGGSQNIKLGYLDSGVSAPVVTNQYVYIDCGNVPVPAYFLDVRDLSPYTKVDIYLPFIGIRSVATEDVIGCLVNIRYKIDVLTGAVLCEVFVTKRGITQCLYTYAGNCAVQIPLTSGDRTRLLSGIVGGVMGAVTGGGAGAIAGSLIGGLQQGQTVERTGSYTANSGAMGIKKPYIIVNRKDAYDATNYNRLYGYPVNESVILSSCRGYTKVKEVHVDNLSATNEEKNEIETLLKNGVIIN